MTLYALDGIAPTLPGDASHWIAPNASLIGRVMIGRQVAILFGAVLRGDNEPIAIGDGSNIQDNSVLHTDPGYALTIGRNCTIGHLCLLHGCTIADDALIGMGSTILNGARIGEGSVIGAGSLITEGKIIEDN
ncbi:MAG: gamma carbonic anhydrase family protein, partial [Rhodobacteraceae bacterium]|nr:gamma carbonic anhydrase family protein [Paracoccaceae bacterium]